MYFYTTYLTDSYFLLVLLWFIIANEIPNWLKIGYETLMNQVNNQGMDIRTAHLSQ